MTQSAQAWIRRVSVDEVPEEGLHIAMQADAEVRAAIAQAAGLRDLPRLDASFDLTRGRRGDLHVVGEISATVGQNCVVTLEAIEQNIVEPVDLVFVPEASHSIGNEDGEAIIGLSGTEPPEPLVGGSVDLGAIATEYLLLGIDPYPRKEGVVFEGASAGEPAASPFAALTGLKKKPPRGKPD